MPHLQASTFAQKFQHFLTDHVLLRTIIATLAAGVSYLFGVFTQAHYALLLLVTLDTITGFWRAAQQGQLRSSKLFSGAFRKITIYAIFLITIHQLVLIVDVFQWMDEWSILFVGATEALSIIENLHEIGLIIPKWVSDKLHNILEKNPYEKT